MDIKYNKIILLALMLIFPAALWGGEQESATAKQVVETFQGHLIEAMKAGKKAGYAGRYEKLYEPVAQSHDLEKIARIILGKEWEKLTPEQQRNFVEVFSKFSVSSYAHNFKDYEGESFVFDSVEETSKGGVVVHTRLKIPNEKDVRFDYMLKQNGNTWRIINIIANGVSDLALKRTEYTSVLQREGFDALIKGINEKIDKYSKM